MGVTMGPTGATGARNYTHLLDSSRKWNTNRRLMALNAWIFLILVTSYGTGYDSSMMNGLQSLTQWTGYFGHPHGGKLGLLNAIQNIGALAAYPFAPYLSDGIGRRRTIWFGAVSMVASAAVQTASQNIGMFIGARFMIGFSITFCINAAPLLITELAYPPYRAPLTSLYNSMWYSGSIVAAWATFGTFKIQSSWAWRIPSALQALPCVVQMFLLFFVPESPRWLVSRGRDAEAIKTLAYYHADGDESDALVQYEYQEIKAALAFDREVATNVGYKSFIATPGNRRRIRIIVALAFFSEWSGNGLVSYYLNKVFDVIGITNPEPQLLINGILQIWNLFWAVSAALLSERLGRRLLFIASAAGMMVSFLFQTVCSAEFALKGSQSAAHAVIAFIFLFYASYDIAFTPLIVAYTVEILPYPLRAKGYNVFNFIHSAALIFNQYVNPIALDHLGWKYYILYVCWLSFELVFLVFFVVETKGRTLEQTAALFDGNEATDRIVGPGDHGDHEVKHDGEMDKKSTETP